MEQLEWPVQKWPEQENVKWYKDREVKFNEPENCLRQTCGTFQNDTQAELWLQDKKEENKEAFFSLAKKDQPKIYEFMLLYKCSLAIWWMNKECFYNADGLKTVKAQQKEDKDPLRGYHPKE